MTKPYLLKAEDFEAVVNGKETRLLKLTNKNGMQVFLTNYGARIVSILVYDKNGNLVDVNVGHSHISEYTRQKANYYGAVIGRVCGRIRDAEFTVEGTHFKMKPNNGTTFLHGGENGFHAQVFEVAKASASEAVLKYHAADGEEGFPGNLDLTVTYTLDEENALHIRYEAVSDKATPLNLTNHAYFNLNGEGSGNVGDQQLQIFTDKFLEIRDDILPTGKILSVENTPFNFTKAKPIGRDIDADEEQIQFGSGYDHTFVLTTEFDHVLRRAAFAEGDQTGIKMEVLTDQPGVHLYSGNFMEEDFTLKSGGKDKRREAFCLETQHLADALTYSHFPTAILKPGERFHSETVFKFSV